MLMAYIVWVMVPESMLTSASRDKFIQPHSISMNAAPARARDQLCWVSSMASWVVPY